MITDMHYAQYVLIFNLREKPGWRVVAAVGTVVEIALYFVLKTIPSLVVHLKAATAANSINLTQTSEI